MTTFFTADTHFGHANIIKYCDRPFNSVWEMDTELIKRWNSVVGKEDVVWHLGDFCFGNPNGFLENLNGKIHIIEGSHDSDLDKADPRLAFVMTAFETIKVPIMKDGHHVHLTMCHYALRSWPLSHYGHWHLFGHHHGKLSPYGMSFDIGVDCWDFYPVPLERVAEKMKTLSPIVDYSKSGTK